jgi:hypothetical protein
MRYRGGGVGHMATRQCNEALLADRHTLLGDTQDNDDALAELVGYEHNKEGNESEDEDIEGPGDDNDDELVISATNDIDIITAAGLALL